MSKKPTEAPAAQPPAKHDKATDPDNYNKVGGGLIILAIFAAAYGLNCLRTLRLGLDPSDCSGINGLCASFDNFVLINNITAIILAGMNITIFGLILSRKKLAKPVAIVTLWLNIIVEVILTILVVNILGTIIKEEPLFELDAIKIIFEYAASLTVAAGAAIAFTIYLCKAKRVNKTLVR